LVGHTAAIDESCQAFFSPPDTARASMKLRRVSAARLVAALAALVTVVFLAGCGALGGDQNTFAPAGEVADKQRDLFILVTIPATIILFLVSGVLLYALVRYRRRREDEAPPKQVHGNIRLEIAWTVAPALLLVGLAVPTVAGIVDLGRAPSEDAMHVRVVAFRFGWQFQYLDPEFADAEGEPLKSDELHIPVDREIGVELEAQDVIHSFWVPKLAGKLDAIPGRTNRMWFNATEPGTYPGQCAELCGIGHAGMRFNVVAETEEEFEAWAEEQMGASAARE
jgi:cytochrome c oxidase subunit 2